MFRVLSTFLLLFLLSMGLHGQVNRPVPGFKNGVLSAANSLQNHKINHPLWESARFNGNYYVVVQMDSLANPGQKSELAAHGILLGQWLFQNNYLAICKQGFEWKNPTGLGIKNIYAIPPEIKLRSTIRKLTPKTGPYDLMAITCFPMDKNLVEGTLRESGAEIVETKIKPYNTWFIRGTTATLDKLSGIPFVSSISPLHLEDVPLNYNNHAIHGVNSLATLSGRNLSGKNLVLGIGDNADPSTHIDLAGKLILRTDEPVDDHGTHTSGILAGGGILDPMFSQRVTMPVIPVTPIPLLLPPLNPDFKRVKIF